MSEQQVTVESLKRIADALKPQPQGDEPRLVVVCNPDEYAQIQRTIVRDLGNRDVLVKPNPLVECGRAYVIDGAFARSVLDPWAAGGFSTKEETQ